jgi:hypothetical protein
MKKENMKSGSLSAKLAKMKAGASFLEREVIQWLLDYGDDNNDIESALKNLLNHGCVSGMVGSLIYYTDTSAFFKRNSEEIMELWDNINIETGQYPLPNMFPSSNWFAWFGFEETARKVADKLGIEI